MSNKNDISDELSSVNPLNQGFIMIYPERWKEVQEQKRLRQRQSEPGLDKKEILDREEASRYLNISVSTLDRHVKGGTIPVIRLGGRLLFRKISLQDWLSNMEVFPEDNKDAG